MFRFLELSEVEELHAVSLNAYGGLRGIRDLGMVESALSSAENTAFYANGSVFDVAAAYIFHLAEAQAFIALNRPVRRPRGDDIEILYDAMIALARHELDKPGLAALLRKMFG